jgi:uncharacterized Zn-binding protein involved in type VI secretion
MSGGKWAARKNDVAPCALPNHIVSIITDTPGNVLIANSPLAHRIDTGTCADGTKNAIAEASYSVKGNQHYAARFLDRMVHGGYILTGWPMVLIGDVKWSHANESFPTRQAAAEAACDEANAYGIPGNREYAGAIYQNNTDPPTWSYTSPQPGTEDGSNADNADIPKGATQDGDYHCHGDFTQDGQRTSDPAQDDQNSQKFSKPDTDGIGARQSKDPNYGGYLATPTGQNKQFDKDRPLGQGQHPIDH